MSEIIVLETNIQLKYTFTQDALLLQSYVIDIVCLQSDTGTSIEIVSHQTTQFITILTVVQRTLIVIPTPDVDHLLEKNIPFVRESNSKEQKKVNAWVLAQAVNGVQRSLIM